MTSLGMDYGTHPMSPNYVAPPIQCPRCEGGQIFAPDPLYSYLTPYPLSGTKPVEGTHFVWCPFCKGSTVLRPDSFEYDHALAWADRLGRRIVILDKEDLRP